MSEARAVPAYEPDRISAEAIFAVGALLIFVVGLVMWVLWITGGRHGTGERTSILPKAEESAWVAKPPVTRTFPRLQTDPPADLAAFRAREDSLLGSYGWIDRGAGKARVPVARAMEIWVNRARGAP